MRRSAPRRPKPSSFEQFGDSHGAGTRYVSCTVNVTVTTGRYKSGTKFWLVRYRLPDGTPIRKFFPDKQSAENYAECRRRESADAMMIPEALKFEAAECAPKLQTHNWTLRRATEYILQKVVPFEGKPRIRDAVALYLKEQAARGLARSSAPSRNRSQRPINCILSILMQRCWP